MGCGMYLSNAFRPVATSAAFLFVLMLPAMAQDEALPAENFTLPTTQACAAQIGAAKPKIYIANFLVTYGKKTMGRLIADNIAFRFEHDERFEVISRKTSDKEMSPMFKKNLKAEEYLNLAVSLASQHQADCVIFGKIGKKGSKISFLVRMASVTTGENRIKVDEDVDKKEASAFFERTGDSLVAYFSAPPAAPAAVIEPPPEKGPKTVLVFWGGYSFLSLSSADQVTYDFLKSIPGTSTSLGGIAGGSDVWVPVSKHVDIGGGLSYLSIFNLSYGSSSLNTSYVPVMAQVRFISNAGLFIGFGLGYFVGNTTASGSDFYQTTTASAFGTHANLGWQISLGSGAALVFGGKFWYIFETNAPIIATPYGGFAFKF